ncbi:hypothetical protein PCCS19_10580 [Paenibacillus sp. CCS19]|uniref:hypothetical protein n=1 Tax=Paenibacillus sp. CCS19 TaxID=3158387 RepID=UPI002566069F|nr:hypothetical protein [Paenibacillus cellulosilyticus]GMK38004.1 hypothetical protein PCCS19_10580 [Paenibacillus cellulosilyticus]
MAVVTRFPTQALHGFILFIGNTLGLIKAPGELAPKNSLTEGRGGSRAYRRERLMTGVLPDVLDP